MSVLDYLGLGALAVGLVALAGGVLWWQMPPARAYIQGALRGLSYLALAALVPLAVAILTRRRPRKQSGQPEQTTDADNEHQQQVEAARARRAETEARIREAEDAGDLEALARYALGDDDA